MGGPANPERSGQKNLPLGEGTRLENYRVLRLLAAGGFSFVYLAHDENESPVAIKEYLPSTLALRTNGNPSPIVPEENAATFRYGLKCFFEEGRALAHLSHPNVVRVLNFFRANETVYLVMRYERGRTLQQHIVHRRGSLDEAWIRKTFAELLNGLREVHSNKLLHLDIKPGNVYVRNDGTPLLIDFGAARQTLSGESMKLPPTYTPGFASPEQHTREGELGPWSDVYSVGATIYACLAGAPPPAADQRLVKDTLVPARRAWNGKYSGDLLDTVDWCLRLDHMERPQSGFALQKALLGEKAPEHRAPEPAPLLSQLKGVLRFRRAPRT
ncbi:MAG: serine/threonine protein kinase [Betaproteobacteria bacterium]|nr:serine/threonine protein kinase [Betaproteobacteria bacterium]